MPPRRYGLSDRDGLDPVFGRAGSSSAATTSGGGAGMVGKAPFKGLGDLGINMRLGEDLGMPPIDAGLERATEEVLVKLLSLGGDDSEGTESEGVADAPSAARGPSAAELLDESERVQEEEMEAEARQVDEEAADRTTGQVTVAYEAWEQYIDRVVGPAQSSITTRT